VKEHLINIPNYLKCEIKNKTNSLHRSSLFWDFTLYTLVRNYQPMLKYHRRVKTSSTQGGKPQISQIQYCHGNIFAGHCILL